MQRDKITYPIVKKYKSFLFWEECRFCKKEFRREQGFMIKDLKRCRASGENPLMITYCCSKCGNDIEDVIKKINREKYLRDIRNFKPPRA